MLRMYKYLSPGKSRCSSHIPQGSSDSRTSAVPLMQTCEQAKRRVTCHKNLIRSMKHIYKPTSPCQSCTPASQKKSAPPRRVPRAASLQHSSIAASGLYLQSPSCTTHWHCLGRVLGSCSSHRCLTFPNPHRNRVSLR